MLGKLTYYFLLLSAFLLGGVQSFAQEADGKLVGKVLNNDGSPAAFATVLVFQGDLFKYGGQTNDEGDFSIQPVKAGTYRVEVRFLGGKQALENVIITAGQTRNITIKFLGDPSAAMDTVIIQTERPFEGNDPIVGTTISNSNAVADVSAPSTKPSRRREKERKRKNPQETTLGFAIPEPESQGEYDYEYIEGEGGLFYDEIDGDGIEDKDDREANSNREGYEAHQEIDFKAVASSPVSTFSIDVDKASYANVRRFLNNGQLPPPSAVRIEEMINYFDYAYPQPTGKDPFAVHTEVSECPWNPKHQLVHIGLQGKDLDLTASPASNLVFLIDVSGSMYGQTKLDLLKKGFSLLVAQLRPEDKVAIVVYAGAAGVVLPSTSGDQKETILESLNQLTAGGSTAGGAGIEMAYKIAKENFVKDGNNRIILATDGDFNVGTSSDGELVKLIEEKRKEGTFLTVLGFGSGNYQDAKMEKLADHGNGNYFYIDSEMEARKVLVEEMSGTLFSIAKDVKIQIEFNPNKVQSYRLIGYENRMLAREDFNDDSKDAGELGAGHSVTAIYEVIPAKTRDPQARYSDPLKYQETSLTNAAESQELAHVKLRYKQPDQDESILMQETIIARIQPLKNCSVSFQLAATVAEFGLILRKSTLAKDLSTERVLQQAQSIELTDNQYLVEGLIALIEQTEELL